MQHDEKQLFQIANEHPYYTFTMEEIAVLCNVSRDFVTRVRLMPDSPFCSNKCRPEWFARWMRLHPEFQLTKEASVRPKTLVQRHQTKINGGRKRAGTKESYA